MSSHNPRYDVAIVGGGMVGAVLAVALSRADFSVALVEAKRPPRFDTHQDYELRASAIADTVDVYALLVYCRPSAAWVGVRERG